MTRDYKDMARQLGFRAIYANWDEYEKQPWLMPLLEAEAAEQGNRSVQKRVQDAKIGSFKPMAEFNWSWPTRVDRLHIEELFNLEFLRDGSNVALIGTNGLGKTMIAQNLAHEAATNGFATLYFKASKMLNSILECDGAAARKRQLKRLCGVKLLVIDEIGYMDYDNRYADLLFEVVSERYQKKSTIITTNKIFSEWSDLFPSAACVVSMVDKLVHNSEIVVIEGKSYRLHEAEQRTEEKSLARKAKSKKKKDDKTS